jgi:hypothetical protein
MGYLLNGVNTGGIPFYLVNKLKDFVSIDIFVETGTAGGESIREAAKIFKECHTIELIENRAVQDLSIKNIKWHTGNSIDVLPAIVNSILKKKESAEDYHYALFWLDAHYCDPVPNTSGIKECPVLEELEIISSIEKDAIIFIDDARLFLGQVPAPGNPEEYPSIQDIFVLLKNKFPHNYSTIVDDYIISIPSRLRTPIDEEWRSRFSIRYPNAEDKLKSDAVNVYNAVLNYLK